MIYAEVRGKVDKNSELHVDSVTQNLIEFQVYMTMVDPFTGTTR